MPETFLARIVAATRHDLDERRAHEPLAALRARAALALPPRDFARALRPAAGASARLIAEVKHASPSRGQLTADYDPVAQARAYAAGGAAAISVLTEPHFFHGALEHLTAVRAAVALPVLRKDFTLDAYQIYEARAAGADAVLLLCALLDDAALSELLALAHALGMAAVVEAHDAAETRRAVASGARLIGLNSRDLRTFAVDPDVVAHLCPLVPPDRLVIAESGIAAAPRAAQARAWGAAAILVGEALMRAPDPAQLAGALASAGGGGPAALFAGRQHPFVKLCGLREPEQVRVAVAAGADAFGLIFGPFRRQVSLDQAATIVRAARDAYTALPSMAANDAHPLAVGIFVNAPHDTIAATATRVGLDVVQLSGDESPACCATVAHSTGLPVIKAVHLGSVTDLPALAAYIQAGATLLLEPADDAGPGGTGRSGDWALAHLVAACWPVILAGGLTPANVASAIARVAPRGVDVSSGTETDGVKDPAKLRAFVAAARVASVAFQHTDG
jgi:indole-3-glycerol phosphate synthase/phosphoribosylanthranilate isomerase/anthranilate synthase/indole-3-glycerol phosphate synthase/phosphoribosylanthranilate isomerase